MKDWYTYLQIIGSISLTILGQVLLKRVLQETLANNSIEIWQRLPVLLVSSQIFIAILSLAVAFLLWILALAKTPLNIAYALTTLSYILMPIASYFFLGEKLTWGQIFGIALIMAGLFVLLRAA
jgi:drug/metabolite transporter (DMT)-like permease